LRQLRAGRYLCDRKQKVSFAGRKVPDTKLTFIIFGISLTETGVMTLIADCASYPVPQQAEMSL